MYIGDWRRVLRGLLVIVVLFSGGCGDSAPAPKTDLNEQEKQQIRELNQQRVDEWGKRTK